MTDICIICVYRKLWIAGGGGGRGGGGGEERLQVVVAGPVVLCIHGMVLHVSKEYV